MFLWNRWRVYLRKKMWGGWNRSSGRRGCRNGRIVICTTWDILLPRNYTTVEINDLNRPQFLRSPLSYLQGLNFMSAHHLWHPTSWQNLQTQKRFSVSYLILEKELVLAQQAPTGGKANIITVTARSYVHKGTAMNLLVVRDSASSTGLNIGQEIYLFPNDVKTSFCKLSGPHNHSSSRQGETACAVLKASRVPYHKSKLSSPTTYPK